MMESNRLVVGPKLDRYNYSMMEPDTVDSVDSDDESFNYVIDLDYKSDESGSSHENTDKPTEGHEPEKSVTSPKEDTTVTESKEEMKYNYTINAESVLDLRSDKSENQSGKSKDDLSCKSQGKDDSSNTILDLRSDKNENQSGENKEKTVSGSDENKDANYMYVLKPDVTSKGQDINYKLVNVNNGIDGLKLKSTETGLGEVNNVKTECNKKPSQQSMASISKPVGASKRKRKFTLENAISNIMKVKTVCTRDISFDSDRNSLSVPSSPSSISSSSSSLASDHSNFNENQSFDLSQKTSQLTKPAVTLPPPVFSSSYGSPSIAALKSSSISCSSSNMSAQNSSTVPAIKPQVSSLSSSCASPYGSPSIAAMKSSSLSFSPVSSSMSSTSASKSSAYQSPMSLNLTNHSTNGSQMLTQKSSSRRKSSAVFRADTFIGDSSRDVLDMTVKKEPESSKPTVSYSDGVIDLSKPSKNIDKAVIKDLPETVNVQAEPAPVDLSYRSQNIMEDKTTVKPDAEMQQRTNAEQLKVMDIFKDLMSQNGGGDGTGAVSMPQFLEWIKKTQPSALENMNMMQISAYYMQFCYWMQTFFNNSLMTGLPNQNGVKKAPAQKRSRQKNGQRKSLTAPFTQNNSLSPILKNDREIVDYSRMYHPEDLKPVIKKEALMKTDFSDYNANTVKQENINYSTYPEIRALQENHECLIAERDGKMKFLAKDNEEILTIVNTVIRVSSLQLTETEGLERDENGLCPKFICRICQQKFFHQEHLSKHMKTSHIQKRFQCSQCERSFHDAGNYRQHTRVHDESDIPFECPECNRRFRHKCTLKVHMRIHTGEKPFKCDFCQASFKISSGLQTHMRKHTGETPYACEFCSLRFKCQSNLKQHMFQHTQSRPFPCEICGKSYSRKSIRDSHLLTHYRNSHMTKDLNITV